MRDRVVLLSVAIVALLGAFYFMVLSPKRDKASKLGEEITQLESQISQQEQVASFAEQARQEFPRYYGQLVVLGKAVPDGADQSSMIVQLNQIATRTGADFRTITLAEGSGTPAAAAAAAPAAPPADGTTTTPGTTTAPSDGTTTTPSDGSATPADGSAPTTETAATPAASTSPAPATEAMAASLPIGATVGPAGLPIMPYELTFQGSFFDIADFMSGVDSLVHLRGGSGQVAADGRLLTVDGFSLKPISTFGEETKLKASFLVTSYVVPSDEDLTAGASPTGPSSSLQPQTTPTSTTTPTVTP
jgi:Tfp pilus assembly protein PilO